MGAMRAMVVVEGLPLGQPLPEVHVVRVAQELVELLLIRAVGTFDLPIELRRPRLDVDVADALIGQVPVEEGLELMPAVGAHRVWMRNGNFWVTWSTKAMAFCCV